MRSPAHQALEDHADLSAWFSTPFGQRWILRFFDSYNEDHANKIGHAGTAAAIPYVVDTAETFWVSREICDLVQHAAQSMPDQGLRRDDIPSDRGFMVLDRHLKIMDVRGRLVDVTAISWAQGQTHTEKVGEDDDGEMVISKLGNGFVVQDETRSDEDRGIILMLWSDKTADPELQALESEVTSSGNRMPRYVLLNVTPWPYTFPVSEIGWAEDVVDFHDATATSVDEARDAMRGLLRYVAALWSFMQGRVPTVTSTHVKPYRALDRRLLRQRTSIPADVQVIDLRRRASCPSEAGESEINWTHRWWVTGHWRNQYMPSLNEHRLIWIMPYCKGPEDRPILERDRVFRVVQ